MALFRTTLAASLLVVSVGPAFAGSAFDRPQVSRAVRADESAPLAELAAAYRAVPRANYAVPNKSPLDLKDRWKYVAPELDPVISPTFDSTRVTPSPLISFDGLSDDDNAVVLGGRVVPPDTEGDVGLTHYVQAVNTLLAAYNKSTGARTFGPVAINALWSGFGGECELNNDGDPIVLYDDAADRWMISQFAIAADGHQCIAVSTTNNPAGTYFRYDFIASPAGFNDYPKLGVWPDGYYMSANEFFGSFSSAIAVAFERSRMLVGDPAAQMVRFTLPCGTQCFFAVQPAHYDGGTAPPAGAPNTFTMAFDDETWGNGAGPDGYRMWNFSVNWASPGSSSFTALPQVNAPEFDSNLCNFSRACIRQPSPGERLDPLGQFTMYRAQYRNFGTHQTIVLNHTVDADGRNQAGVRWAELRNSGAGWTLHQTGTVAPDSSSRWVGSISIDKNNNIAVGYSVSSRNLRPSIRYATRNAGDPLGTISSEVTLQAGAGVQQSSSSRWGDYSTMSVDPSDDCTFWYTQEYYANNGSFDFKTRIGAFRIPGCAP